MTELPYTESNVQLVQDFINETRKRITNGTELTFTPGAARQAEKLMLDHGISTNNIVDAMLNLTPADYFRGINQFVQDQDYDSCAFRVILGSDNIEIYLKYGLEKTGVEILLFSNHEPQRPMNRPFAN